MIEFSLGHDQPTSIRYPKSGVESFTRAFAPIELGKADVMEWGVDGAIIACGTLLSECRKAAEELRKEGLDVGVINARFLKPLDTETIFRALEECNFVITVEEGVLPTGFGSAVLEAASDAGLDTRCLKRLGLPDRYVEHGDRKELLEELGLTSTGIAAVARRLAAQCSLLPNDQRRVS